MKVHSPGRTRYAEIAVHWAVFLLSVSLGWRDEY